VNVTVLETTPPGFSTRITAVPADAINPAGTDAVRCALSVGDVDRFTPFHCTTEAATNPLPTMFRVR